MEKLTVRTDTVRKCGANAAVVEAIIAKLGGGDWTKTLSQTQLSQLTGVNAKTVCAIVKRLEAAGIIEIMEDDWRRNAPRYRYRVKATGAK